MLILFGNALGSALIGTGVVMQYGIGKYMSLSVVGMNSRVDAALLIGNH